MSRPYTGGASSERLPNETRKATDLPDGEACSLSLLGAYDAEKNKVIWAVDGDALYDSPLFMDGTNWFTVWRVNDVVHCRTTQWYHPRGDFCMRVTDLTPADAVALASKSADIASQFMDGDLKLEKTS